MKEFTAAAKTENISKAVDFVIQTLTSMRMQRSDALKAALSTEEALVKLIENADEDAKITITVQHFGSIELKIRCKGRQCTVVPSNIDMTPGSLADDAEAENTIRNMLMASLGDKMVSKYVRGENIVKMQFNKSRRFLFMTMGGMILGLIVGIIMQFTLPQTANDFICNNIFLMLSNIFMNAIKMIIAPLVFFSICSSIAGLNDIKTLGKSGTRVFLLYMVTSVIAITVAFGIANILPIGNEALQACVTDSGASYIENAQNSSVSLIALIAGIVPANFIKAFSDSDMLQIIFISILLGVAAMKAGKAAPGIRGFLDGANELFSEATSIIIDFLPISAFCSMAKLMAQTGFDTIAHMIPWIGEIYLGAAIMLVAYGLLIFLLSRRSPFIFYKKYYPAMLAGFSLCSSNATLPTTMEMCGKLGISKRIYSFSLPLGSIINMDGGCISMMTSAFFLSHVFGITLEPKVVVALLITVLTLSIGAPSVPGASLVCTAMLLPVIGVPMEGISIILGLYALVNPIITLVNTTGDAAVTLIVASRQGMVNDKTYNS